MNFKQTFFSSSSQMQTKSSIKNPLRSTSTIHIPILPSVAFESQHANSYPQFIDMDFQITEPSPQKLEHYYGFINRGPSEIDSYEVFLQMPTVIRASGQNAYSTAIFSSEEPNNLKVLLKSGAEWIPGCDIVTNMKKSLLAGNSNEGDNVLDCSSKNVQCTTFKCNFQGEVLGKGKQVELKLMGTVLPGASKKLGRSFKLVSFSKAKVTRLPYEAFKAVSLPGTEELVKLFRRVKISLKFF